MAQRIKTVQESDLRMLGDLARNIQRVLPVTQADIDAAAALGKGWVVTRVFEVSDPLDNLRGGTQLVIRQNSVLPGQSVQRVLIVSGPGGQTVVVRGTDYIALPDAIANSLSYVKTFGGTHQGNIPNIYTQVNYVTNTAQTAVDTGIMIDFAKNYEFEIECRATTGSWYILQSRASSSGNVTGISGATSGNTITLVVGNVTVCTSAITRTVGNKLYVKATRNAGTATLYVKDETANTEDTKTGSYGTSQPNPTASVYLLGNAGGQYVDVNSDIYMARIKENDTVVMDYVPARQVATAGFYDKASGTFKTATAGTFAAGGEAVPTPDTPMNIVSNNGALKVRRHSGLPLDYQQIEWLKSTQAIELDKPTKDTYELQACFYRESLTAQYVYQSDTTSGGTTNTTAYLSAITGNWRFDGQTTVVAVSELEQVITTQNKDGVWLNDTQVGTYTNVNAFTSTSNLKLFGAQVSPKMRLYWFKMLENETPVYDIIPVRKMSTNELGVYDKVSGQFFTNSDSTLTAGNDISDPIEVYADDTIETIKVCGKNLFDSSSDENEWVTTSGRIDYPAATKSNRISAHSGSVFTVSTSNAASSSNIILVGGEILLRQAYTSGTTHTVTAPAGTAQLLVSCRTWANAGNVQVENGSTATEYQPYYDGGTATAEMLLKVGDYQDEQEILSGTVTRKVGVLVLDGTENWTYNDSYSRFFITVSDLPIAASRTLPFIGTHYKVNYTVTTAPGYIYNGSFKQIMITDAHTTVDSFKQWLADQYAAGTPVIVIYPLNEPTTESVAGQTLQVTDGDNTVSITQASLSGLELEAEYQAAVALTIQEVQDANLDNNVEVTIS